MGDNESFDSFWFEERFRVSICDMKLSHIQDRSCKKPFVVIGYNSKEMSYRRFKNKIRSLGRAMKFLVSFLFILVKNLSEKWSKIYARKFAIS